MSAKFFSAFLSAAAFCTSLGPALAADPQSSLDAAGHHLAVVSEGDTIHRVTVDGKSVFTDQADERLGLTGPYTGQGRLTFFSPRNQVATDARSSIRPWT
ncbi:hypothetical protein [Gluconobacter oxydans]|uniref:hypothetical protein n=1 Tax=Gluconobacter oxydans TaxID=442 RepID=UPI002649C980|nr:hypothetical protein [Gluconobacter oxydans]WKE49657.1 hypothetical protein NUJ38_14095 [Gluconobacter oxydans]